MKVIIDNLDLGITYYYYKTIQGDTKLLVKWRQNCPIWRWL